MHLDIRTLVFVLSITQILQIIVFSYQYVLNRKNYRGVGWWLMWSAAGVAGFTFMLLREIPSVKVISIFGQNLMIIAGVIFLYIGIMRFFGRKENRGIVISIFAIFLILFMYFLFVVDDFRMRGIIICTTLAAVSFMSAHALFFYKPSAVASSANFTGVFFLAHGLFFVIRSAFCSKRASIPTILPPRF